ncbi:MAG: fluoride efflux transporter CrcB [Saprospiraceae bacterium]|nr:fluoride efflux transporter CrcB [Saprospiraceae bacterium]
MPPFLLVFLGGGLGSVCRWSIGLLLQPLHLRFPWATFVANGLACLLIGCLLGWQIAQGLPEQRRLLLSVGFCGGFSTFSSFTVETWQLWQQGHLFFAAANVLGTLTVCLACLLLGLKISS